VQALAVSVAIVQFLFTTTWTLYVIYLPSLAQSAGLGREWVAWLLVADQLVFAVMDIVTGFWVDRVRAALGRFGGWMVALSALSCAAFVALPYAGASASVLLAAIAVWAITSSALRSPPWALLARYAPTPRIPWLSTLVLTGTALASALAPYLGVALRGVDPRVPFIVSTATLLATVVVLMLAERRLPGIAATEPPAARPMQSTVLFAALLLLALGFQVHFALNSAPRYVQFASREALPYLMPVFWIGFNLLVFPAARMVERWGTARDRAVPRRRRLGRRERRCLFGGGGARPQRARGPLSRHALRRARARRRRAPRRRGQRHGAVASLQRACAVAAGDAVAVRGAAPAGRPSSLSTRLPSGETK
jgi:MFS family permease